ncbi:hypothetical protein ZIOFF_003048 [Zingiber officinale]|uniref:Uncharacterized protein n=1 Tax=Zingiber officinale TaxID=94328 RepID=A0A8J5M9U4_ZINOF|nr:hypothetical protein ZIOFF_003048 [Zingiber officinale]
MKVVIVDVLKLLVKGTRTLLFFSSFFLAKRPTPTVPSMGSLSGPQIQSEFDRLSEHLYRRFQPTPFLRAAVDVFWPSSQYCILVYMPLNFKLLLELGSLPTSPVCKLRIKGLFDSLVYASLLLGSIPVLPTFSVDHEIAGISNYLKEAALRNRSPCGDGVGGGGSIEGGHKEFCLALAEINANLATEEKAISAGGTRKYSMGEVAHMRETAVSIKLAKEVIKMHQEWRREAVRDLNRKGGFSRSLANSSTDWPSLLLDILSSAAEIDFFQPKLVINNVDVLRKAILTDDSTVSATMYHDSFIWRLIALGVNERCLPVVLVTSDSYYSYRAFIDFGFPNIFISRETFGWTPQEAKLHMVSDFFKESEWKVIDEVLGSNPRQLYELYVLKQSGYYPEAYQGDKSNFEDIVDAYLSYLQVTVVNPAMESALLIVQKFAFDAYNGKVSEDRLHFGAPWRHPPRTNDSVSSIMWAKIQLIDFVQSFLITEFGVNYLADQSLEILDDPSLLAMLEVGLLYTQRDPSFVRPITRGIQRCLVRWLVQQKLQMDFRERLEYLWQRIIRGRSYRHLMKESGYKR